MKKRKQRYSGPILGIEGQPKIYNSIKKYGWKNHKFEIIEECSIEQLDEREIYWGLYYDTLNPEKGLNLKLGNGKPILSEETKQKIGDGNRKPKPDYFGKKVSISRMGFKMDEESKNKISLKKKGHICYQNPERGKKISDAIKGKPHNIVNPKGKEKIGIKQDPEYRRRHIEKISKPVLQYDLTGNFIKEWPSTVEIFNQTGIHKGSIWNNLNNKSKSSGGFVWKYKFKK
jgi:group I intron endonuclease